MRGPRSLVFSGRDYSAFRLGIMALLQCSPMGDLSGAQLSKRRRYMPNLYLSDAFRLNQAFAMAFNRLLTNTHAAFQSLLDYRVLNEIPSLEACIVTAGTVRFSLRDIFSTPTFCFASPFNVRTSVVVQGRRIFSLQSSLAPFQKAKPQLLKTRCASNLAGIFRR